jgi:hypothetical protein
MQRDAGRASANRFDGYVSEWILKISMRRLAD